MLQLLPGDVLLLRVRMCVVKCIYNTHIRGHTLYAYTLYTQCVAANVLQRKFLKPNLTQAKHKNKSARDGFYFKYYLPRGYNHLYTYNKYYYEFTTDDIVYIGYNILHMVIIRIGKVYAIHPCIRVRVQCIYDVHTVCVIWVLFYVGITQYVHQEMYGKVYPITEAYQVHTCYGVFNRLHGCILTMHNATHLSTGNRNPAMFKTPINPTKCNVYPV